MFLFIEFVEKKNSYEKTFQKTAEGTGERLLKTARKKFSIPSQSDWGCWTASWNLPNNEFPFPTKPSNTSNRLRITNFYYQKWTSWGLLVEELKNVLLHSFLLSGLSILTSSSERKRTTESPKHLRSLSS